MSIWSAIGLADRDTVKSLTEQIESLRKENNELLAENQRLIFEQLRTRYDELYEVQNQSVRLLDSKIEDMQKDLRVRMDGMLRLINQKIATDSETIREIITLTKKQIEADIFETHRDVKNLAALQESVKGEIKSVFSEQLKEAEVKLEQTVSVDGDTSREAVLQLGIQMNESLLSIIKGQKEEVDSVIASVSEMKKSISNQSKDIKEQIWNSFDQIFNRQQELSVESCEFIAEANKDFILRIEKYCTLTLEEIQRTGDKYNQMEHDEQESLDKMKSLSSEMLELGEHQKNVMDQLSQLCQDSAQFMEIQKSINDMWEIMKAVWVDSLLNNFDEEINLAILE